MISDKKAIIGHRVVPCLGVLGGTFDPVHNGHLMIADEVRKQLDLGEVLFVPAGLPWLKCNRPVAAAYHRLAMVRLAISNRPHFKLSTVDIDRSGPSYTIDTIADLLPRLGTGAEMYFILGWDSMTGLAQWREPGRLIQMCRLAAVPRPGYPPPDLEALEQVIPGIRQRVVLMGGPEIDISATDIRQRAARGQPIEHLVPGSVEKYIREHGLYNGV